METKPYNLQSPEQIAKEYGGNKQKIAEAMQMGIIDPTAGTMAGMFIDRMRSAAQTEAAPQQTVAQQVFAPPAPMGGAPAGLGAVPVPPGAGAMPSAPPAGLGGTPEAAAMAPQMPQEMPMMAEGGMVPPYMSGSGLSDMPLPDGMFDESSNGGFNDGYAGGGLIAFAAGDMVDEDGDGDPNTYFGYNYKDPMANAARDAALFGVPETKYAQEYEADLLARRAPEARSKRRKEDMWMALGQIGARMAQTPGSIFQAAGAGISEALPGIAASAKERRAEEREIQKGLIDLEQGRNTAAAQKAMRLMQAQQIGIQGREGQIGREFQTKQQLAGFAQAEKMSDKEFGQQMALARLRGSYGDGSGSGEGKPQYSQAQAEKGWSAANKKMNESFTEAENLALKGDMPGAQKKFAEYARFRRAANMYAEVTGQPSINTLPRTKTKGIQAYTKYVEKHGQPTVRRQSQTMSLADQIIAANR
jgi:hypothetical protein